VKQPTFKLSIVLVLIALSFSACKERIPDYFANVEGSYFSINQFILEEWRTHAREPIVFKKTVTLNGKTDSTVNNVMQVDWIDVLRYFSETEIGDRKFLGKYKFTQFDDDMDNTTNLYYMALDEHLYTQKLLITMNKFSKKLTGIYIETDKSNYFGSTHQKLLYRPAKTIQIQQFEHPLIGGKKELKIQYDALD